MDGGEPGPKRPYRMQARAAAAEATREKILEAVEAAFEELQFDEMTLARIAKRAGVSVQTVVRHFGSKEGLFLAGLQYSGERMVGDRDVPPGAGLEQAVEILYGHYERFGDRILRMLGQEDRVPQLKFLADVGRSYHEDWCRQVFAEGLRGLRGKRRERRLAELMALTDIYVWKVLRRDRGLSQAQAVQALVEILEPLAGRPG